jgi:hypothetical protein
VSLPGPVFHVLGSSLLLKRIRPAASAASPREFTPSFRSMNFGQEAGSEKLISANCGSDRQRFVEPVDQTSWLVGRVL